MFLSAHFVVSLFSQLAKMVCADKSVVRLLVMFQFATAMAELLKSDLRSAHVAPYSWREQELIESAFHRVKDATVTNAPKYGPLSTGAAGISRFHRDVPGATLVDPGDEWVPLSKPECSAALAAHSKAQQR